MRGLVQLGIVFVVIGAGASDVFAFERSLIPASPQDFEKMIKGQVDKAKEIKEKSDGGGRRDRDSGEDRTPVDRTAPRPQPSPARVAPAADVAMKRAAEYAAAAAAAAAASKLAAAEAARREAARVEAARVAEDRRESAMAQHAVEWLLDPACSVDGPSPAAGAAEVVGGYRQFLELIGGESGGELGAIFGVAGAKFGIEDAAEEAKRCGKSEVAEMLTEASRIVAKESGGYAVAAGCAALIAAPPASAVCAVVAAAVYGDFVDEVTGKNDGVRAAEAKAAAEAKEVAAQLDALMLGGFVGPAVSESTVRVIDLPPTPQSPPLRLTTWESADLDAALIKAGIDSFGPLPPSAWFRPVGPTEPTIGPKKTPPEPAIGPDKKAPEPTIGPKKN